MKDNYCIAVFLSRGFRFYSACGKSHAYDGENSLLMTISLPMIMNIAGMVLKEMVLNYTLSHHP